MTMINYKKLAIIGLIGIASVLLFTYATVSILCKIYLKPQKIKETLISQVQQRFDRKITVADDISLYVDWDMSPNIILRKFTLSNSTWAKNPNIFTADSIDLNFSLLDLVFKRLNINSIKLVKPQLFIEMNGKQNNLQDLQKDTNSPGEASITVNIENVDIVSGTLNYNQDTYTFDKLQLDIHNAQELKLQAQGAHKNVPFKANIEVKKMLSYFKLNINTLHVGKSDLSGDLAIEYSPVRITGNFKSKNLILKDFTTGSENSSGQYSIPPIELPVTLLRGSKFDVNTEINNLSLGSMPFKNIKMQSQNNKDIITITLKPPATFANGDLSLTLTYDLNPASPVLRIQSKTANLKLSDLCREMFGKTPITGSSLDFTADLSAQGSDLKSLVDSLNGKILIQAGEGEFQNSSANLGNLFTNVLTSVITFDKSTPSSVFKCGVMNFRVSNGVANAKQGIGIEGANVKVLGNGMVDLRNGSIAFSMVPQTISANPIDIANFSVAQLVEVNGTISNPKLSVNAGNLLAQGATAAIAASSLSGAGLGINGLTSALAATGIISKNSAPDANFSPCKTALGAQ